MKRLLDIRRFLNKRVEVIASEYSIKGILRKVEPNSRHLGFGNLLLENNGRKMLIRGNLVVAIRRNKR